MSDRRGQAPHAVDEREFIAWATHVRKCKSGCRISIGEECAEAASLREALHEARTRGEAPQPPPEPPVPSP
ncbi:hypothetical protein ACWD4G_39210 [Streptomyces sp. NPDC002643]